LPNTVIFSKEGGVFSESKGEVMNENIFFREAARRICSTLEIDEGLFDLHELLREIMPVKMIYLQYYDSNYNSMRSIAYASDSEHKKTDKIIHLSKDSGNLAEQTPKDRNVFLMTDPSKFPISREMSDGHNIKPSCLIILALRVQKELLGFLVLTTEGNNMFTQEHADLINMLMEPLVIAMSNALKHMQVLKLNDLLLDDNNYLHNELRKVYGEKIIGADFGLKDVMFKVNQVAQLGCPVLRLGETGTGKDVIANAIH